MRQLAEILDKETEAYNSYLGFADDKKQALLENDMDRLEAINIEEKALTAKILALESERLEFLREHGLKSTITIDELINRSSSDDKKLLELSSMNLRKALEDCKDFTETNMALMRQSSTYINHMIQVFTDSRTRFV